MVLVLRVPDGLLLGQGLGQLLPAPSRLVGVAILNFFIEQKKAAASEEATAGTLEKVAPHADL